MNRQTQYLILELCRQSYWEKTIVTLTHTSLIIGRKEACQQLVAWTSQRHRIVSQLNEIMNNATGNAVFIK